METVLRTKEKRKGRDILKLVNTLISNTAGEGEKVRRGFLGGKSKRYVVVVVFRASLVISAVECQKEQCLISPRFR